MKKGTGKQWFFLLFAVVVIFMGTWVMNKERYSFSLDLQDGFHPAARVLVLVDGKTVFDKAVESSPAGWAGGVEEVVVHQPVVRIELRVPNRSFQQSVEVDLRKGIFVGLALVGSGNGKEISVFQSMKSFS
jgi:hypothetical protein